MSYNKVPELRSYIKRLTDKQRRDFFGAFNKDYIRQIYGGHRQPGPRLAMELSRYTDIPLSVLRPDLWGKNSSSDE